MEFRTDFVHVQDHAVLWQNWVLGNLMILDLIFKQKAIPQALGTFLKNSNILQITYKLICVSQYLLPLPAWHMNTNHRRHMIERHSNHWKKHKTANTWAFKTLIFTDSVLKPNLYKILGYQVFRIARSVHIKSRHTKTPRLQPFMETDLTSTWWISLSMPE